MGAQSMSGLVSGGGTGTHSGMNRPQVQADLVAPGAAPRERGAQQAQRLAGAGGAFQQRICALQHARNRVSQ